MLLPPTSRSSRSSGSSRFGRKRRHIRKLSVVCRILGALCVVAALLLFISSFFAAPGIQGKKVTLKQRQVSAVFFAAAPVLLLMGVGLNWWKYRFYGRGLKRHSSASAGNGNGAPHVADLPAP